MLKIKDISTSRSIWLVGPEMSLGSAAGNDLVIKAEGISPHHARMKVTDEEIIIFSVSGSHIRVNNQLIDNQATLKLNDKLKLGVREFEIIDPRQEMASDPVKSEVKPQAQQPLSEGSGWIIQGDAKLNNRQYPINGEVVLGRSPECALTFSYDQLSRKHAMFKVFKGSLYVKDMGSSNGTLVNGKKVDQIKLQAGDVVSFGQLSFNIIAPQSGGNADGLASGDDLNRTVVHSAVDVSAIQKAVEQNNKPADETDSHSSAGAAKIEKDKGFNKAKLATLAVAVGFCVFAAVLLVRYL